MIIFVRFLLGVIGFVFVFGVIAMTVSENRRRRDCTQAVMAEIVDIVQIESTEFDVYSPTVSWYPIYEYWTGEGWVRVKANVGGKKNKYKIGQKIELYVNLDNLNRFYCPSENEKFIQIIFGFIGMLLLLGCIALTVF